jgi:hypothetical protein
VASSIALYPRELRAEFRRGFGRADKLPAMAHALAAPVHLFDYLASEATSERRHEYVGGGVHAMTGGTARHNRIAGNAYARLLPQLSGTPCQVFINDMKLHVQAADSVYYPDVFVHCGRALAGTQTMAHDATLVIEVLSDSTAEIDRREKLAAYQSCPACRPTGSSARTSAASRCTPAAPMAAGLPRLTAQARRCPRPPPASA